MRSKFWGQPDKALYISAATHMRLFANEYFGCNTVAAMTRAGPSIDITGDVVRRCGQGYEVMWWDGGVGAPAGTFLPAGQLTARGIYFEECESRLLYALGGGSIKARDIIIRDWGFKPREATDATPSYNAGSSSAAIRLDGASNSDIKVDMAQVNWPDTSQHRGFDLRDFTDGGQVIYCKDNRLGGRIANLPNGQGIVESSNCRGTRSDITYDNVATARNSGYGESPIQPGRATGAIHRIKDLDGNCVIQKNDIPFSDFITLAPAAAGGGILFGAPTTNECHYSRGEYNNEVTLHASVTVPYSFVDAAVFTGSISGTTLTVSGTPTGTLAIGQAIRGANVAAGTIITALGTGTGGAGTYIVDTSQTAASGTISAIIDGDIRIAAQGITQASALGSITGTTLTLTSGTFAIGHGITGSGVTAGTVITADLGGGAYTVNKSQTVASATKFRTVASGLPWSGAATGGGNSEGCVGLNAGIIWPSNSKGLVAQIPAGASYIRFRWLGSNSLDRSLSARDMDRSGTNFRMQVTITFRCD
jgi:hypothetical protein